MEERQREQGMEFEIEKLRIEQLGKAYLYNSVGKKSKNHGTPFHELAKMILRVDLKSIIYHFIYPCSKVNQKVYGHKSHLDDGYHMASKEETEDSSVSAEDLMELLSTESGYRAVASKYGLDTAIRRRQMIKESKVLDGDMNLLKW
ncbi:hypothetical protein NPIL_346071 [Nephila pilipes]|uniref:RED-like N-terminal domain-containing protein n=1 Tax=Nephila pilipes TaxID=299642 RepID=A0A8X6NSY2_NEPPI|nr:hypothetical protein NPIL_346071 [Nephila pilipes]